VVTLQIPTGTLQLVGGYFAQSRQGPETGTLVLAGGTPIREVVSAGGVVRAPASGTLLFVGSEQDVLIIVLPGLDTLIFAGGVPTVATAGAGAVLRLPECGLVRVVGVVPTVAIPGPVVLPVLVGALRFVGGQPTSTGGASGVGGNPLEARANIARAGVTYAGWAEPVAAFTLGGTDRSTDIPAETFQIEAQLESTSTATFRVVNGAAPTVGQAVELLTCTPDEYLFRGRVLRVTMARISVAASAVYDVEAADDTWLMDRYKRVWAVWRSCGINTIVADLLDRFTDGGFAIGSVPASLGDVDEFICRGELVSRALTRLAKMCGGYWRINPRARTVDIFTPGADNDGNAPTWENDSDLKQLTLMTDASQLRTRTEVIGGGAATTAVTGGGQAGSSVSCAVDEVGWYTVANGRLRADYQKHTVAGGDLAFANDRSVGSGPGTVIITPPADDIPVGTVLAAVGQQESSGAPSAAETAWAATLGGGLSGFVQHVIEDGHLSAQEAQDRAEADVTMFEYPTQTIGYTTTDRWARLGQYICASITSPVAVQGTFVCQHMTLARRRVDGTNVEWYKRVSAGPYRRELSDLLRRGA